MKMRTIFMHSSTKERFELISDIINILGEKGREVRIDYVRVICCKINLRINLKIISIMSCILTVRL